MVRPIKDLISSILNVLFYFIEDETAEAEGSPSHSAAGAQVQNREAKEGIVSGANAFRCAFIIKHFLISENVIFVRAEREKSRIAFEQNAKLNLGL